MDTTNIQNATNEEMRDVLMNVAMWFSARKLGNPFNYNRAFEFIQCMDLGYVPTTVGGGSDGVKPENEEDTTELKVTGYKGVGKNGKELSHSFTYNGTSRKATLDEQEKYCYNKIMRDEYHHWSIVDYEEGKFVKTYKVKNTIVWKLIWEKWKKSFINITTKNGEVRADQRIGGVISTDDLKKSGLMDQVEVILYNK